MKHNCYNCNHKCTERCASCSFNQKETYNFRHQTYIDQAHETVQPDTSCSEPVTNLPEEYEDKFRKFLYDLFDLSYNELMILKSIMNQKDLTTFAKEMEDLAKKNQSFTRFRAFQTRKAIVKKLGEQMIPALLTNGQRKVLKKN